jgi:hypothetical protein
MPHCTATPPNTDPQTIETALPSPASCLFLYLHAHANLPEAPVPKPGNPPSLRVVEVNSQVYCIHLLRPAPTPCHYLAMHYTMPPVHTGSTGSAYGNDGC